MNVSPQPNGAAELTESEIDTIIDVQLDAVPQRALEPEIRLHPKGELPDEALDPQRTGCYVLNQTVCRFQAAYSRLLRLRFGLKAPLEVACPFAS